MRPSYIETILTVLCYKQNPKLQEMKDNKKTYANFNEMRKTISTMMEWKDIYSYV